MRRHAAQGERASPLHTCFSLTFLCLASLVQGLYPFGDCKQLTKRFPVKELEASCGLESGDWSVMSTTVVGKPMYAVAHRRGGAVRFYPASRVATRQ